MRTKKCEGVSWSKSRNKWEAYITTGRKKYNLGRFEDKQEAINIHNEAKKNIDNIDEWIKTIRKDRSIHINEIYGNLKVLERLPDKLSPSGKPHTVYKCECVNCGTKQIANGSNLKNKSVSCSKCKTIYLNDLHNRVFGRLKVIGYNNDTRKWICECECKNIIELDTGQLTKGDNKSCGCWHDETQFINLSKGNALKVFDTNLGKIQSDKLYKNNTSGVKGVHWSTSHKKWCAVISFKKKCYRLGYYDDIKMAKEIRKIAEQKIYRDFLEWYNKTRPK